MLSRYEVLYNDVDANELIYVKHVQKKIDVELATLTAHINDLRNKVLLQLIDFLDDFVQRCDAMTRDGLKSFCIKSIQSCAGLSPFAS